MTRLPDWRSRLGAYLAAARTKPFAYGTHDCATFAAGAVEAVTGTNPMTTLGISYSTLRGGQRALRAHGYHDPMAFVRTRLVEAPMAQARIGDVAVVETATGVALAVVGGTVVFVPAPDRGLVTVPLTDATFVFRV